MTVLKHQADISIASFALTIYKFFLLKSRSFAIVIVKYIYNFINLVQYVVVLC